MADISEPALAKALAKVKEVVPNAPRLETIRCDVSKESDVQATIEAQDSWGGTDVIFNNAGIMHADDADAVDTPEVRGDWFHAQLINNNADRVVENLGPDTEYQRQGCMVRMQARRAESAPSQEDPRKYHQHR